MEKSVGEKLISFGTPKTPSILGTLLNTRNFRCGIEVLSTLVLNWPSLLCVCVCEDVLFSQILTSVQRILMIVVMIVIIQLVVICVTVLLDMN